MSEQKTIFALHARHALPNQVKYWTREGDYTDDIAKAITRNTSEELERLLETQKHIRPHVVIVPVNVPASMEAQR